MRALYVALTLEPVADSGVGVLLIEQFAHVALGLATGAYVLEGGHLRDRGTDAGAEGRPGAPARCLPASRLTSWSSSRAG